MAATLLGVADDQQIAPHAELLYKPKFWDPRKAYADYVPDLEGAFLEGAAFRRSRGKSYRTAAQLEQDGISNCIFLTDLQSDFRDRGRLPVRGADDVVLRAAVRLLNGITVDYYTRLIRSQDGHPPYHTSYGVRWMNVTTRDQLDLRTYKAVTLTLADRDKYRFLATAFDPSDGSPIELGEYRSMLEPQDTVAYWDHLQETDQGPIWAFAIHCQLGTDGVALHPLLTETLCFVQGARAIFPTELNKGHILNTDWFGPFEPCRPDPQHAQGGVQAVAVEEIATTTGTTEFFGVAEDFCDHFAKKQVVELLSADYPQVLSHLAFATDGTAPIVPGAAHVQRQNEIAREKGVRFFTHDEPIPTAA